MSQQWWYVIGQQMRGPVSSRELRELARKREITPETMISPDKIRWARAEKAKGLYNAPQPPSGQAPRLTPSLESETLRHSNAAGVPNSLEASSLGSRHESAGNQDAPSAICEPQLPVIRIRSGFWRTQLLAVYGNHVLKGRRYLGRVQLRESMCYPEGETSLIQQLGGTKRIDFEEVVQVREQIGPKQKRSFRFSGRRGFSEVSIHSNERGRIRLWMATSQVPNVRAALSAKFADRYEVRTLQGTGCSGIVLLAVCLMTVAIGLVAALVGGSGLGFLMTVVGIALLLTAAPAAQL